jgi:L-ascorbate metabolism protein UlaG (beta-lactamase superfamily)
VLNIGVGKKAKQISKLVRYSALTRRTGRTRKPTLARPGELALTFIGHSSFFAQIGGASLVIDPIFTRWLFLLKRLRRPGLRVRDLPPIEVVLVSHAHFDHLHRPSLKAIVRNNRRKRAPAPVIIVPRHVGDLVSDLGFCEVVELEWWQEHRLAGLRIVHTPSNHWGARILRDMHRGFGGYLVQGGGSSLYHAGDTAYFGGFREIGRRLAPEIALLPIGAYHPASYRNVHTNPEDAVQAFLDLGAQWLVPMHYGTFRLSQEPMEEPLQFLAQEAREHGVQDSVLALEEGVTAIFAPAKRSGPGTSRKSG